MTVLDVYDYINSFAPFSSQLDFDNAGLLVGDKNSTVTRAVVALDVTDAVIDFAVENEANLIVTHHPVIFEPLKSVTSETIVFRLIKSGISVISAHTNLDMASGGVNDCLCDVLGLSDVTGILPEGDVYSARLGHLETPVTSDEFAALLSDALNYDVKYVGDSEKIETVAVCSGSGGSMLYDIAKSDADAFVTADIKHNVFLDAEHLKISLYDCGHFNTEDIVINPLCRRLNENFGDLFIPCHITGIKFAL